MNILLTRPSGRNQQMIEALSKRGVSYLVQPLLAIEPSPQQTCPIAISKLSHADIIIFISTNAVKFAADSLSAQSFKNKHVFAVGNATKLALEQLGIQVLSAPDSCQQTEGLLALNQLQDIESYNVLIVRGKGGRETLAQTLTQRGAQVDYWETYQRIYPPINMKTISQWQQAEIDTIIITSGEILKHLNSVKGHAIETEQMPWLHACAIVVPSQRVYQQAIELGFKNVINAKAANTQAVLNALSI